MFNTFTCCCLLHKLLETQTITAELLILPRSSDYKKKSSISPAAPAALCPCQPTSHFLSHPPGLTVNRLLCGGGPAGETSPPCWSALRLKSAEEGVLQFWGFYFETRCQLCFICEEEETPPPGPPPAEGWEELQLQSSSSISSTLTN